MVTAKGQGGRHPKGRALARVAALLVAVAAAGYTSVHAQGVQTGVITGAVTSADGLGLPGVTVTVSSPALQGTRTSVTDVNGNYVVRGLPPGEYTVTTELSGMQPKTERTIVALSCRGVVGVHDDVGVDELAAHRWCSSSRVHVIELALSPGIPSRIRASARAHAVA